MVYIGIDLGGTNIAVGIVNEEGAILAEASTKTLAERPWQELVKDMGICAKKALEKAAEQVKGFVCVELNMGQMIEDVKLYTGCKKPVGLCNRCGGMIPSPDQVLESSRNAQKGVF